MTCHHSPGDPNCSSNQRIVYVDKIDTSKTPDAEHYEIVDVEAIGAYLAIKVKYPNCNKCAYEGTKVLVVKATMKDALKWRRIDPHFRDNNVAMLLSNNSAPSPEARFPASEKGWQDALDYASKLAGAKK